MDTRPRETQAHRLEMRRQAGRMATREGTDRAARERSRVDREHRSELRLQSGRFGLTHWLPESPTTSTGVLPPLNPVRFRP
jgi:hypothetical protein